MKYLVAMSGGVDSSVSLLLAKDQLGDGAVGLTLSLSEKSSPLHEVDEKNIADAAAVCRSMGVEHLSLDVSEEFSRRIKDYFVREYLLGRTPNPCVICNREIKLGVLSDYAESEGFSKIVTGHYARTEKIGDYVYLKKAADPTKDQSYVLAMLSQSQLSMAHFPLGELTKAEVRELAANNGFASASRRDSQDICFIPDGDYVSFISRHTGLTFSEGDYVDENGRILGRHKGQLCYTIGQRKGLGISMGRHIFVLKKDAASNTVTLGDEDRLYKTEVKISSLNLPSDPHALDGEVCCTAKLRYAHREAPATFIRTGDTEGLLRFAEGVRAPSPGQFAVMYSGEYVLGGGIIE